METTQSRELRKSIEEQIRQIKAYVDGFELIVPKDETALGEIGELLASAARSIKEMDDARVKRKRLMGELNEAFFDLEKSQQQFAESLKNTP